MKLKPIHLEQSDTEFLTSHKRSRALWLRFSRHCPAFEAFSKVKAALAEAPG